MRGTNSNWAKSAYLRSLFEWYHIFGANDVNYVVDFIDFSFSVDPNYLEEYCVHEKPHPFY